MAFRQTPGGGYIQETGGKFRQIPGGGFVQETLSTLISFRALILSLGIVTQLPIGQEATGKKPLVVLGNDIKERATTEGLAIILDGGIIRTINLATETLVI